MRRLGVSSPPAIGESVELLDIAERMAGLRLDPCPQPRLQRTVRKLERAARQRAVVGDGHDLGLAIGDGDEDGDEVRRGRIGSARFASFRRCPCHVGRPSPLSANARLAISVHAASVRQTVPIGAIGGAAVIGAIIAEGMAGAVIAW